MDSSANMMLLVTSRPTRQGPEEDQMSPTNLLQRRFYPDWATQNPSQKFETKSEIFTQSLLKLDTGRIRLEDNRN